MADGILVPSTCGHSSALLAGCGHHLPSQCDVGGAGEWEALVCFGHIWMVNVSVNVSVSGSF